MPWYIPLISALLGASIGFIASFIVTKIQFERQSKYEHNILLSSFSVEIEEIIKILKSAIEYSSPQTIISLPSKKEIESICSVYRGNCGKIGVFTGEVAIGLVKFYTSILSMRARERAGLVDRYDSAELQDCIHRGEIALRAIKGPEVNYAWYYRK